MYSTIINIPWCFWSIERERKLRLLISKFKCKKHSLYLFFYKPFWYSFLAQDILLCTLWYLPLRWSQYCWDTGLGWGVLRALSLTCRLGEMVLRSKPMAFSSQVSMRCIDPIFRRARTQAYLKFLPFVHASRILTIPLFSALIPAFRHLPAPLTIPDSASIDPSILCRSRPRFNHIFIYSDSYLLFDFSTSQMRFLLSFNFQTYA